MTADPTPTEVPLTPTASPTETAAPLAQTASSANPAQDDVFHTEQVITLSVAHGSHDTYFAFLPTLLPVLIEKLSMSTLQAGLLAVFWQGPAIFQPIFGYLADRVSLRYLVILAPAISATMISLVPVIPTYVLIAFALIVAGLASATVHSIVPAMTGRYSGGKLGRGMSIFMVGGELGFTIGPFMAVFGVEYLGLERFPLLMLYGWAGTALLFFRLRDGAVWKPAANIIQPALLPSIARMRPMLLPLAGVVFCSAFLNANTGTFLPTFLTGEGASLWLAGAAFSIVEGAGTVGTLLSGWLSDRIGRRTILIFSAVTTPLFALLFLSVTGWMQFVALLGIGFSAFCTAPAVMAMVQEAYSDTRALANGAYMAMSFVIRSLVVVIVGALADVFGLRQVFYFSTVMFFLGLGFVFLLPKEKKKI